MGLRISVWTPFMNKHRNSYSVQIFADADALSQAAAQQFTQIAQKAVTQRGRFLAALAGGGTPEPLYRLLSQEPYRTAVPWANTHLFWGDERLVPPNADGSNYGQVEELLLRHVPIPAANVHRAKGECDPKTAVADYRQQLQFLARSDRRWPRLDLALMGMGSDGHTASLFPGPIADDENEEPVVLANADYDGRPSQRVTLTPLVFNDARHVLFLVTGQKKAETLTAVLQGPSQPEKWPAQRIQPQQGALTWLVDDDAAANLAQQT